MHYNWKVYGKYKCPECGWLLARKKSEHEKAVSICCHCKIEMYEVDPVTEKPMNVDEYGACHKFQETIDLIDESKFELWSVSMREIEEGHIEATMAFYRAVGYALMAEELEPYNPWVLNAKAWAMSMSGKSAEFMVNVYSDCIAKIKMCNEYGYPKITKYPLTHLEHAIKYEMENLVNGRIYDQSVKV